MKKEPESLTRPAESSEAELAVDEISSTESLVNDSTPSDKEAADEGKGGLGALTSRLFKILWGLGALAVVGSAVTVAIEQHRQTSEMRKSGCYARAAAAAAVAATEIARSGSSGANPGLTFLECDQVAGIAP
jgi:hypothetical protein